MFHIFSCSMMSQRLTMMKTMTMMRMTMMTRMKMMEKVQILDGKLCLCLFFGAINAFAGFPQSALIVIV